MCRLVALAALALGLAVAPSASSRPASEVVGLADVGSGAAEAWVFTPEGEHDCVLTFIHDDGDLSPERYTSWLDFTALSDHCVIVFPRYQATGRTSAAANLRGLRASLGTGLAYAMKTSFARDGAQAFHAAPKIVAGYGSGATLALAYATRARTWHFDASIAVDAVFPVVSASAPLPSAKLGAGVHVLVQLGDRDRVAGRTSGLAVRRYLAGRRAGLSRVQVVRSTTALPAVHSAPLRADTPAQNAFWGPLDLLISSVTP